MDKVFYETLLDENASCHLALGDAYPTCVEKGADMSEEEQKKAGLNDSMIHVDFMVGSPDLTITDRKRRYTVCRCSWTGLGVKKSRCLRSGLFVIVSMVSGQWPMEINFCKLILM